MTRRPVTRRPVTRRPVPRRPLVRRARRWAVALTVALAAVACAGGELSTEAARDLQDRVAEVRAAAEAGDVPAAEHALADLRAALEAHTASGQVDDDRAAQIAGAADLVADRLALLAPEPRDAEPPEAEAPPTTEATPEPQETRTPPSTQPPLGPPDDRDDDDGDGRGGDDSGDGGDETDSDETDGDETDGDEADGGEADGGDEDGRGPDGAGPPGQRSASR